MVEVGIFGAGIDHQHIEGPFGEKELVGGVVDLLAAKVPDVGAEGGTVGVVKLPAQHVDPFS